jgi:ferredoxin
MGRKEKITADYRKNMQELVDVCRRAATHFAISTKQETLKQFIQIGVDEFRALEILDATNAIVMKYTKCGSTGRCARCGTEITL